MNALIPLVADGRYHVDITPLINFYLSIPFFLRFILWFYILVKLLYNLFHLVKGDNKNV